MGINGKKQLSKYRVDMHSTKHSAELLNLTESRDMLVPDGTGM